MADIARDRADLARNRRRILDASARVLAQTPNAGMTELAAEAGVGRATLYRHFPSRELLLDALEVELVGSAVEIITRHAARPDVSAAVALGDIVEELIESRARYQLLFEWHDRRRANEIKRRWDKPLLELIERGQQSGELNGTMRPRAILVALAGLTRRALKAYVDGEVSLAEAQGLARTALLHGFER